MDYQGLPGIDELFREQDRLARKLSQAELTALKRYLRRTVHMECESVVARLRFLQAAHHVNESQFQRALGSLQKDLQVQQTVAGEFRREFGSLAQVLQAREQRYQARHDTLIQQVLTARQQAKGAVEAKEAAEAELQAKDKEMDQLKDAIVDLEDQLANHRDCDKLRQDHAQLGKDLLKAKLDTDRLRKDLNEATAQPTRGGGGGVRRTGLPLTTSEKSSVPSTTPQHKVRFAPSALAPKNSPVTFTPSYPYCTSNACRARQDLEECRVLLVKKSQEVARLQATLTQRGERWERDKSRDQRVPPAALGGLSCKPSELSGQRAREGGGGLTVSPLTSAPLRSFKLGPARVLPPSEDKP